MYRALPETVHAAPFATSADAQAAHVELVDQARLLEERHGNALPGDDPEIAAELARLRRRVRAFEWRLSATGARLPEGPQRGFAQSLLDFWALRQCDLRVLMGKFRASRSKSAYLPPSGRAAGRLLVQYDERTAQEAAKEAEAAYLALPTDAERESARTAFLAIATQKAGSAPMDEAPLGPFVEAGLLVRHQQEAGVSSFIMGHEALTTSWPRLAEWLAQSAQEQADLERVKGGAEAWERSGSVAELPRGEVIERALRYSEQDDTLTRYAEAARRRQRIERAASIGVWVFMALLAAAAIWAYWDGAGPALTEITKKFEDNEVVVDVPDGRLPGDSAAGAIGWIWAGSENDAKVVGEGDEKLILTDIHQQMRLRPSSNLKLRTAPATDETKPAGKRFAGVSSGTPVLVLDKTEVEVEGTMQHWLKVQLVPVIYIQFDASSTLPIERLRSALRQNRFDVPAPQKLTGIARRNANPAFDVRFYYRQDEPAAKKAAELVAQAFPGWRERAPTGPTDLSESALAERVKTGTIEVWLFEP